LAPTLRRRADWEALPDGVAQVPLIITVEPPPE
jgi:hypothetical protein